MPLPTSKAILRILNNIKDEGYTPDTPAFERRFRALKVQACQVRHGVSYCTQCSYYENCELVKAHMRDRSEAAYEKRIKKSKQS